MRAEALAPSPVDARAADAVVTAFDGTRLATDVYLPRRSDRRRHPTILVRLPYDKGGYYAFMPEIAAYLVEHGFAVVVQDVRGKGRSGGETRAFVHEAADGAATLDWIAAQPWSNGAVGMFGDSYYGVTQWAAASTRHPALRAIVPRFCSTRVAADWLTRQGVFCLSTISEWAAMTWVDRSLWDFEMDWSIRPLREVIPGWLAGRRSASYDEWIALLNGSGLHDHGLGGASAGLSIPALHVGGTWDVFNRGQIADFRRAARTAGAPQHLLLRATDHYDDTMSVFGRPYVDKMADAQGRRALLPRMLDQPLAFFRRYLAAEEEASPPAVEFEIAHGGTRRATGWPPPAVGTRTWYLAAAAGALDGPAGGALAARPDRRPATLAWVHDPELPVPSGIKDPWRPLAGLPDERRIESRPDVPTFTGEAFGEPFDIVGLVELDLELAASGQGGHLMAKLVDVAPTGRATMIGEGALLFERSPESQLVTVDLANLAYRLRSGHRLRIEVAGSSFPRYPIHPGTDEDPLDACEGRARDLAIVVGRRSRLRLQHL